METKAIDMRSELGWGGERYIAKRKRNTTTVNEK